MKCSICVRGNGWTLLQSKELSILEEGAKVITRAIPEEDRKTLAAEEVHLKEEGHRARVEQETHNYKMQSTGDNLAHQFRHIQMGITALTEHHPNITSRLSQKNRNSKHKG